MNLLDIDQPALAVLVEIARQAGNAILSVYERPDAFNVDYKADDSPITEADRAAHQVIERSLAQAFPGVPVLSEESPPEAANDRLSWKQFWLVDPLDGTKEFISRNGEFTVNIALIQHGRPVAGVVLAPVLAKAYAGARGVGAFSIQDKVWTPIQTRTRPATELRIVGSRRHGAEALDRLMTELKEKIVDITLQNVGSSLKFCLLAEGGADVYPRLAPTSEWDTAAAQAVLEAAGGLVEDLDSQPLLYNKPEGLLNPFFIALASPDMRWLCTYLNAR